MRFANRSGTLERLKMPALVIEAQSKFPRCKLIPNFVANNGSDIEIGRVCDGGLRGSA